MEVAHGRGETFRRLRRYSSKRRVPILRRGLKSVVSHDVRTDAVATSFRVPYTESLGVMDRLMKMTGRPTLPGNAAVDMVKNVASSPLSSPPQPIPAKSI